jgi:hypothetical protein
MSEFGSAFKAARKAGKKAFDFKGKSYNTKYKEEVGVQKSTRPMPRTKTTAKPDLSSGINAPKPPSGAPKASIASMPAGKAKTAERAKLAKSNVKKAMSKAAGANFR